MTTRFSKTSFTQDLAQRIANLGKLYANPEPGVDPAMYHGGILALVELRNSFGLNGESDERLLDAEGKPVRFSRAKLTERLDHLLTDLEVNDRIQSGNGYAQCRGKDSHFWSRYGAYDALRSLQEWC